MATKNKYAGGLRCAASDLFLSTNPEGIPVLRDNEHLYVRAFKLRNTTWCVYDGGTARPADPSEMVVIKAILDRVTEESLDLKTSIRQQKTDGKPDGWNVEVSSAGRLVRYSWTAGKKSDAVATGKELTAAYLASVREKLKGEVA